ncbi:MAG TPA: hypothetical protein VFB06_26570 [Streptosporangiaceae bacterium]|nr:hypothetical protein [Streptosporangiaceae bacterium]
MYSSQEYAQEYALQCVTDAIEKLDAKRQAADPGDLETQVAAVWAMVGAMDPELAKVASRYAAQP